jgi:hypothetical protein
MEQGRLMASDGFPYADEKQPGNFAYKPHAEFNAQRQAEMFEDMRVRLTGCRWTMEQAGALMLLIAQGAAHVPLGRDERRGS